jgi:hypothetical protein
MDPVLWSVVLNVIFAAIARGDEGAIDTHGNGINWSNIAATKKSLSLMASTLRRWVIHVNKFQVELYRKVFLHLDTLNPRHDEVWLGRDGEMGYYARLAHTRKSKRVKYLIFPRSLIGMSRSETSSYLASNGVDPDGFCPYFVDSGYEGSIPEFLMKTLWDTEYYDEPGKFIRLFSSHREDYRIPNLADGDYKFRDKIVELEHAPKFIPKILGVLCTPKGEWKLNLSEDKVEHPSIGKDITLISPLMAGVMRTILEHKFRNPNS